MTVSELQERYPDHSIVVSIFDDIHNGDYLFDDNTELAHCQVRGITAIDESGAFPMIRCYC